MNHLFFKPPRPTRPTGSLHPCSAQKDNRDGTLQGAAAMTGIDTRTWARLRRSVATKVIS